MAEIIKAYVQARKIDHPTMKNRVFLRFLLMVYLGAHAPLFSMSLKPAKSIQPKIILIQFGGGVRSSETIDDSTHAYIPHLWNDLAKQGTLFSNMRVEHAVVHPNSTGSIMTGFWEYSHLDWSKPVTHPTIFEVVRKTGKMDDLSAWAFVYASILAKTGYSSDRKFGPVYGANVVVPPTIPLSTQERIDALMDVAAAEGPGMSSHDAIDKCAKLARTTSSIDLSGLRSSESRAFVSERYAEWKRYSTSTSHDKFLAQTAIACMEQFAPAVMAVCFGEIDCAHYGSWSRYCEAIQRTDELTWEIWNAAQKLVAYFDNTLFIILPDHGRESESPKGTGYIHHSNFYIDSGADESCRRVWMLLIGPRIVQNRVVKDPFPITAAASTALEYFGIKPAIGAEPSVLRLAQKRK
jgi:hypothetical protein